MKEQPWLKRQNMKLMTNLLRVRQSSSDLTSLKIARGAKDYLRLGDRYRDAREWSLAKDNYHAALKLRPTLGHIWVQYGHSLKECGEIFEAYTAYKQAIALGPDVADSHLQLGHVLKLQGRLDNAAQAYARALSLDSTLIAASDELSTLCKRLSDIDGEDETKFNALPVGWPEVDPDSLVSPFGQGRYSSIDDLLSRFCLLPDFIVKFDAEYYAYRQNLGRAFLGRNRVKCLVHFCEWGILNCAAISDRLSFDKEFYDVNYNSSFSMTSADSYRHWLNHGLRYGHAPNETVWLQDVQQANLVSFDQLDLAYYQAANPRVGMTTAEIVEEFLDGGIIDGKAAKRPSKMTVAVFEAAAHRAAIREKPVLALRIAERVLAYLPDHLSVLSFYADRLSDEGRYFAASQRYEQIIRSGEANRWTYRLLAAAREGELNYKGAFEALKLGSSSFPQFPDIRDEMRRVSEVYLAESIRQYEARSAIGRIKEGQALIKEFCDITLSPLDHRLPKRSIRKIALFALLDLPQCRFYRVDQKVEHLESAGFIVGLFDSTIDLSRFLNQIYQYDAVIFYRVAPLPNIAPAIQAANALGLTTFYEIDDLLFLPEEYPGSFESYAGQISRELYAMLAMGVPLFQSAMMQCDFALASTPTLAREMAKFVASKRAFVHRNGMGSDHEHYLNYVTPRRKDGPVTIFYGSGTLAHKEDFSELIEPALLEIAKRHKSRVRIVLIGWLPISPALREVAELTVIEPVFDLHRYWNVLREADINLAVLKPSLNVDCKSEIKWMEAAMFGIPSVVSHTATYAEVIEDGQTGFLCKTVNDWVSVLDRLILDGELRRRIGLRAQEVVRKNYSIDIMGKNLQAIMLEAGPSPDTRNRKKILFVNVFYSPQTYGGATRVMADNIAHLISQCGDEFEVEVFTCLDEAQEDYVVSSYAHSDVRVTSVSRSVDGERTENYFDRQMADIFRKQLDVFCPDLIHFHCIQRLSMSVVMEALEAKIPYVITAHDAWWISDHQFLLDENGEEQTYDFSAPLEVLIRFGEKTFSRMQALRPALFGAQKVLGVSESFSNIYKRCGVTNVSTIANGVSELPKYERKLRSDDKVVLGHVGGLSHHKGYFLLKYALLSRPFKHLTLRVVDHSRPKQYVHEEMWGTVPVTVIGKVKQTEVAELYTNFDVLMAPSLWPESFGLATREASFYGCWVVASDQGAIGGDVTEGVDGHIVDVSDLNGLLAVLEKIDREWEHYKHPPARTGRLRTAVEQGDELAVLYRSLLGETGRRMEVSGRAPATVGQRG